MLTDLYALTPTRLTRRLYRWLGIADGAHEWLCDAGLCPCAATP